MFVICDNQNIVRHYAERAVYVKAQTNGVTVGADNARESTAIYSEDDSSYWPTKEVLAGQKTYTLYEVDTVPDGADVGITRYNVGKLEIDEDLKAEADAARQKEQHSESVKAQVSAAVRLLAEQQTDEATMMMLADLYEEWAVDRAYPVDKVLKYGTNPSGETQLYRVVQAHTSQADWTPDKTASLYKAIGYTEDGVDIWTQPLAAYDAYNKGDLVSHKDKLWTSDVDGNVWEPGVYGWTEKTE